MAYRTRSTTRRRTRTTATRRRTYRRKAGTGYARTSRRRTGTQTVRIVVEQPQQSVVPLGLTMGATTRKGPKF